MEPKSFIGVWESNTPVGAAPRVPRGLPSSSIRARAKLANRRNVVVGRGRLARRRPRGHGGLGLEHGGDGWPPARERFAARRTRRPTASPPAPDGGGARGRGRDRRPVDRCQRRRGGRSRRGRQAGDYRDRSLGTRGLPPTPGHRPRNRKPASAASPTSAAPATPRKAPERGRGPGCGEGVTTRSVPQGAEVPGVDRRSDDRSAASARLRQGDLRRRVSAEPTPIARRARSARTRDAGLHERLEPRRQLGGVGEAPLRILVEAALDHGAERRRGGPAGARRASIGGSVTTFKAKLGHRLGLEGPSLREQLEEHDAERPDVGPRVDVARRAHLLGRHVERRAEHRARLREADAAAAAVASALEMPKSSTLISRAPPTVRARNRFSGLRSRWTMPAACASATASHACRIVVGRGLDGQRAPLAEQLAEVARPRGTP